MDGMTIEEIVKGAPLGKNTPRKREAGDFNGNTKQ
jgi:hypothetical protein